MKIRHLMAVVGLVAAGTALSGMAMAGGGPKPRDTLFSFDGAIGVQPLRAGGVANAVAGVNPGGAPWGMTSFVATIKKNGTIRANGTGVLLWGTDNIGTRGGPRQVILSLFCRNAPVAPAVAGTVQTTPFNSLPVDLDEDGDFEVRGTLTDANGLTPPLECGNDVDNRPVLLVRAVIPANPTTGAPAAPGAWFAAGVIAAVLRRDHDRDRW